MIRFSGDMRDINFRFRFLGLVSVCLCSFIALMGIVGYLPGLRLLASVRAQYIPMAPSTAVSFLLLSVVVGLYLFRTASGFRYFSAIALSATVPLFGFLKFAEYVGNVDVSFEQAFIPIYGRMGNVPIGLMSPLTGILFLIAGTAVILIVVLSRHGGGSGFIGTVIGILGSAVFLLSLLILLAYFYGQPFLYGRGAIVPTALTTAAAFLFLGTGIMLSNGPERLPASLFVGVTTKAKLARAFVPLIVLSVLFEHLLIEGVLVEGNLDKSVYLDAILIVFVGGAILLVLWVGNRIGETIDRTEREIKALSKFPAESPHPVLRIAQDGTLLYCNNVAGRLFGGWKSFSGQKVPQKWLGWIDEVSKAQCNMYKEEEIDGRLFSFELIPIKGSGYVNVIGRDITERRQTEDKIKLQQYYLEKAQEIGRIGTWEIDIKNSRIYWTDENYRIFGIPPGSVVDYDAFLDRVHPDDRNYVKLEWESALAGKPFNIRHRLLIDGATTWVREKANVEFGEDGKPAKAIGFAQDITDRVEAENIIQTEIRMRKTLIDNLPCIAMILRKGTREIVYSNSAAIRAGGVLGKTCYETFAHRDSPCLHCLAPEVWSASQTKKRDIKYNGTYYEEIWVPLNEELYVHYLFDTSEKMLTQERLKEVSEELQLILDATPAYIWFKDTKGRILKVNKSAAESVGMKAEDMAGKPVAEIFSPAQIALLEQDDLEMMRTRQPKLGVIEERQLLSGERKWVRVDKVPLIDEQNNVTRFIIHALDITQQLEMERKLRQSEKMEVLGQLAGGVAHDFNNQLSVIMGFAEMLQSNLGNGENMEFAEHIVNACKRSRELTSQMLAFARKGKYRVDLINIHEVIAEVVKLLHRSIDKQINIKQHLEASPPTIKGDETQIQNALLNIAINARDAMPKGGDLVFETYVVNFDPEACAAQTFNISPGQYLLTRISDHGVGMDKETLKHAFEPFYTTKKIGQGTGMGLAAVYGTAENHGGMVSLESEVGKGTSVNLYLPVADRMPASNKEKEMISVSTPEIAGHVLLVDDEAMVLKMCARMLHRLGCKVTAIGNGKEAIEYYRSFWKDIDLVVLDLVMPEISGHEMFCAMSAINPRIKAIVSSGYSIEGRPVQDLIDEGIQAFIQKPFEIKKLHDVLIEVLGS